MRLNVADISATHVVADFFCFVFRCKLLKAVSAVGKEFCTDAKTTDLLKMRLLCYATILMLSVFQTFCIV